MSWSTYLDNKVLDHITAKATFTAPTWYVALFTTTPTNLKTGSGGTEVTGGSYARVAATFATSAASGAISNSSAVTFTTATGNWGTVVGFGCYDASTAGNFLGAAALGTSKPVNTGDTAQYAVGQLSLTLD